MPVVATDQSTEVPLSSASEKTHTTPKNGVNSIDWKSQFNGYTPALQQHCPKHINYCCANTVLEPWPERKNYTFLIAAEPSEQKIYLFFGGQDFSPEKGMEIYETPLDRDRPWLDDSPDYIWLGGGSFWTQPEFSGHAYHFEDHKEFPKVPHTFLEQIFETFLKEYCKINFENPSPVIACTTSEHSVDFITACQHIAPRSPFGISSTKNPAYTLTSFDKT